MRIRKENGRTMTKGRERRWAPRPRIAAMRWRRGSGLGQCGVMTTTELPIPADLRASADADGPDRIAWLGTLPERVDDLARRWRLDVGPPFEPGGTCAWVAPALDGDGRDLVLKIGWTHTEALHEAEGLAAFGGHGAVEVHAYDHDGDTTSLLIERCRPGDELRTRPEPEQHRVITDLLRRLWSVPLAEDHPFRSLTSMCEEWADQSAHKAERQASSATAAPDALDLGLLRDGLALLRELPRSAEREVLLCTDLHAGNVLCGARQPWLLIDPKPYVGDPHYDVLQHLLNCGGSLQADPLPLLGRVSDLAGLEPGRVRQWLFARCAQESPTWPELAGVARRLAP